jgi:hypothetical protein
MTYSVGRAFIRKARKKVPCKKNRCFIKSKKIILKSGKYGRGTTLLKLDPRLSVQFRGQGGLTPETESMIRPGRRLSWPQSLSECGNRNKICPLL